MQQALPASREVTSHQELNMLRKETVDPLIVTFASSEDTPVIRAHLATADAGRGHPAALQFAHSLSLEVAASYGLREGDTAIFMPKWLQSQFDPEMKVYNIDVDEGKRAGEGEDGGEQEGVEGGEEQGRVKRGERVEGEEEVGVEGGEEQGRVKRGERVEGGEEVGVERGEERGSVEGGEEVGVESGVEGGEEGVERNKVLEELLAVSRPLVGLRVKRNEAWFNSRLLLVLYCDLEG